MVQQPGPAVVASVSQLEEPPSQPLTTEALAAIIKGAVSEAIGGVRRELESKISEQKIALKSAASELESQE